MDKTAPDQAVGILLLSGAGLGSWAWEDVIRDLKFPAVGVDFPKTNPDAGMDEYVAAALKQANSLRTQKIVVVGHSLSGTVGLKVAEELGDRLAGFVAVAAAIPKDGGSFVSALPFPQKFIMPLIIRLAGTKPSEQSIRKSYCNDLTPELGDKVVQNYTSETKQIYFDRSTKPPQVPRLFVLTTDDADFPVSMQEAMARNLGATKTISIKSGHLPMLAKPAELAGHLSQFCAEL